jgi:pyridinium-3,5-bisthiocarboxylic acid mononucleotide nickel chelatase
MRVAYWDCFSGISGDMALGALLDAGLPLDHLHAELRKLPVEGWEIEAERSVRYGIGGTKAHVRTQPQHVHRRLADIREILHGSTLDPSVRDRALAVFGRLADAEGYVHGVGADAVHFHEVGALDAIVDIVGVCVGLALLGVEAVYASPLPLGSGWIKAAHGLIPIPGPAVLQLLGAVQAPITPDMTPFELVTPTGAALLAEYARWERPAMRVERTGYGFGTHDTGRLNAVRVWLGETAPAPQLSPHSSDGATEQVVLLETNLDDQPAEQIAFAAEQAMTAGALDAWWQPIGMKKGRPATTLSVLVAPQHEAAIVELLLRETTSLGVRRQTLERWVCERETRTVATPWGDVRVKLKRWRESVLGAAPEYEDCARLARANSVPLREVYAAAQRAAASLLDA